MYGGMISAILNIYYKYSGMSCVPKDMSKCEYLVTKFEKKIFFADAKQEEDIDLVRSSNND